MNRAAPEALSRPFKRADARTEAQARVCDHPDCQEAGLYRAPRSRDQINEYFWFCLEHVRSYNRAWNYYAGMDEEQIESERRRDSTWHRPSWPFGSIAQGARRRPGGFRDDFGFFSEEEDDEARAKQQWNRRRHERRGERETTAEERALAELDLEQPITFAAIKARYKDLVKRLHPDANGGDRSQEDKLKAVNQAYATLRSSFTRAM